MSLLQFLVLLLYCVCLELCSSIDTISFNQSIQDPGSIVSNGQTFELGFFSPVNTTNRYVGIWYNGVPVKAVVWVANRGKPLNDSSGAVKISNDGDLVVLDGQQNIIWSSNLSSPTANSSAQLLETGNLVLRDNSNGSIAWESFQHPSDSFLAKMIIGNDVNTNATILMTSWKSLSDPSVGRFSAGLDPLKYIPEIFVWNGSRPHWRSGPWNGQIFTGVPYMESLYLDGFNIVNDKQGGIYVSFTYANESRLTYFVLNSGGTLMQKYWDEGTENWESNWSGQISECDVYGKCGPFGSCNSQEYPICTCLTGFVPKSIAEWSSGNWTSGCVRKTPLQCEKNNSTGGVEGKEDGFLKLKNMKVPDFAMWSSAAEDECENECLKNCSCVAYAYHAGIGCMLWSGTLVDIQKFSITRPDLYIRLAYSDLEKKRNMNLVIAISVIIGSLIIAVCTYFSWCWRAKRRDSESGMKKQAELLLFDRQVYPNCSDEIIVGDVLNQVKLEELPLFKFDKIAIATDNFSSGSKLGQGGFGPVYKGILPEGGEIAVKRLSKSSGQGLKEFMNEVLLISKLQHRNLVRLLGCCAEGEEKILIYEYMPNKSLDAFLFDPAKQKLLDWKKRFNIIEGIGRGLLYLHRDSRLKIIHRDLKASNILLDEELKPKISDFGMARIFGGNQDQENTRRVVGTYGYMAPEYAMEGRFSEKSDVFSFGVLLLEIISGRRNTSFYQDEHSLGLVGFAWKLWNEDNNVALIDPTITDPLFQMKILGWIHVGLLCVQEFAKDRPSISSALSMLTGEIADLPIPKQPALTERHVSINAEHFQQNQESCSINSVTITAIGGR